MRASLHRAFTLIELMIVIAVIGIMVGSLAAVLRTGDRGPALQAAQASLSGLVTTVRAQAAMDNSEATLVIWGDRDDPETYLRRAAVAVRVDTNDDGLLDSYTIKSDSLDLPRGVFFVPANSGAALPAKLEVPGDWSAFTLTQSQSAGNGTTSSSSTGKQFRRFEESSNPKWQPDPDAPVTYYENITFDSYGRLISKQGATTTPVSYLAVANGDIQVGTTSADRGVVFREVDALRGLKLSVYGLPIQLNEKSAFEP